MKITCEGLENFDCKKVLITKPVIDAIELSKERLVLLINQFSIL